MNKDKFKFFGQLVLDIITAVWLVVLSALGSGCVATGSADWDSRIEKLQETEPLVYYYSGSSVLDTL